MKRIRIIGVAFVAVFALSAVAAPAASASGFEAETYPVSVFGEANGQEFTVFSGTINCTVTFSATLTGASATLSVTVGYTNCTFAGLGVTTVNMEGCTFTFHVEAEIPPVGSKRFKASVDVVCPTGKEITVRTATCVVKVPAQTGLKGIELVDVGVGATREVEVIANVNEITYNEGALCTKPGKHEKAAGGIYKGKVVLKGTDALSAQEGIFVK
jgi:hypothetical protein